VLASTTLEGEPLKKGQLLKGLCLAYGVGEVFPARYATFDFPEDWSTVWAKRPNGQVDEIGIRTGRRKNPKGAFVKKTNWTHWQWAGPHLWLYEPLGRGGWRVTVRRDHETLAVHDHVKEIDKYGDKILIATMDEMAGGGSQFFRRSGEALTPVIPKDRLKSGPGVRWVVIDKDNYLPVMPSGDVATPIEGTRGAKPVVLTSSRSSRVYTPGYLARVEMESGSTPRDIVVTHDWKQISPPLADVTTEVLTMRGEYIPVAIGRDESGQWRVYRFNPSVKGRDEYVPRVATAATSAQARAMATQVLDAEVRAFQQKIADHWRRLDENLREAIREHRAAEAREQAARINAQAIRHRTYCGGNARERASVHALAYAIQHCQKVLSKEHLARVRKWHAAALRRIQYENERAGQSYVSGPRVSGSSTRAAPDNIGRWKAQQAKSDRYHRQFMGWIQGHSTYKPKRTSW